MVFGTLQAFLRCGQDDDGHQAAVVSDLQDSLAASGLGRGEFARELGTSQSRLSTYVSGKIVPSAAMLMRARNVAALHSGSITA
ncbi:hypothetical protein B5P43_35790 [Bacillus sp. SRB_336]|nr:hypothetical protein B5P43_35790 [Bacillus sp. SRB_336]